MKRTGFLVFWALAVPVFSFAASTTKAPLQLDNDTLGDLILYASNQGSFTNVYYDPGQTERFDYVNGPWPAGVGVTAARLNNDSRDDAFLYNATTGAYAFAINNGSGYTLTTGSWSPGWQVYTADFNKDGLHDLLLYNPVTGQWFQCFNDGATGFTYNSGVWPAGRSITPGDFNGDGRTDFFVYDGVTGRWFEALTNSSAIGFDTSRSATWSAGWDIQSVTFNNDTLTDLFLYNRTTGDWVQCVSTIDASIFRYTTGTWSPGWIVSPADFDGDGINDFFLYNDQTGVWFECYTIGYGTGIGGYIRGTWSPGWRVYITDFDGDKRTDVLVYNPSSGVRVQCINTGLGTFDYRSGIWAAGLTIVGSMDRITVPPPPAPTPAPTATLTVTKILAFGDSITFGAHSSRFFDLSERTQAPYPDQLLALLRTQYPQQDISVINAGLGGELAYFALPRLQSVLDANRPDLVLILEGTNDVNAGLTASQISAALNDLIRTSQAKGAKVTLAKLIPIGLAYDPTGFANRVVQGVNAQITSLASTQPIGTPVDLYTIFTNTPSYLGADGLHPTDAGYTAMARAFFDAIVAAYQTPR